MITSSLQQAIALIKSGDKQNGKRLLAEIIKADPKNETAWLWMSSVLDNNDQRRHCLEHVLVINPDNQLAQKGLAQLQRHLRQSEPVEVPKSPSQVPPKITEAPPTIADEPPIASPPKTSEETAMPALASQPNLPPSPSPKPKSSQKPVKKDKRVWLNPKHMLNKVIILYNDKVVAANPDGQRLKHIQTILKIGTPSPEMLGKDIETVPIRGITMVSTDKRRQNLTIRYKSANKKPGLQTLYFANRADRDEFFAALQQKLGAGFECVTRKFNAFSAILFPIVIMAVLICATYIFYGAALEIKSGAEPEIEGGILEIVLQSVFLLLVKLLGPTGIMILGVILIGWVLFWAAKRVMNPPIMMMLIPAKNPAGKVEPK